MGFDWVKAIHPDDQQLTFKMFNGANKDHIAFKINFRLKNNNNEFIWHQSEGAPRFNDAGRFEGFVGSAINSHLHVIAEDELRQANLILTNRNLKLKKLNELRDNLLHIIAHDLKGPLGNMHQTLTYFYQLEEQKSRDEILQDLKKMIVQQQKVLDGLIEIIKVQKPKNLHAVKVNLSDIMRDVNEVLDISVPENGKITFNFDAAPHIHYVERFIFSILFNLVSNAVKYRHNDRALLVEVKSKREDEFIIITVKDNGMGITGSEKEWKDIFRVFQRNTDKCEGSGIGLYIVKTLIEGNGGHVSLTSSPETGTTFFCYLKEYES